MKGLHPLWFPSYELKKCCGREPQITYTWHGPSESMMGPANEAEATCNKCGKTATGRTSKEFVKNWNGKFGLIYCLRKALKLIEEEDK